MTCQIIIATHALDNGEIDENVSVKKRVGPLQRGRFAELGRGAAPYRSSTSRSVQDRDTQIIMQSPVLRSSCVSTG